MTQGNLFEVKDKTQQKGIKGRGDYIETTTAIENVEEHADELWADAADRILEQVATQQPFITALEIRTLVNKTEHETHDKRAMGPVMLRGVKRGIIENSGELVRTGYHGSFLTLWKSLICQKGERQ